MAEIRFKAKNNEVRLNVIVEKDGAEVSKELVFNCSPTDYKYVKNISKIFNDMQGLLEGKMNLEKMGKILDAEKAVFEAAAPGKWDEFIELIGCDIEYMAQLLKLMVTTIQTKGIEAKLEDIAPVIPDGETV